MNAPNPAASLPPACRPSFKRACNLDALSYLRSDDHINLVTVMGAVSTVTQDYIAGVDLDALHDKTAPHPDQHPTDNTRFVHAFTDQDFRFEKLTPLLPSGKGRSAFLKDVMTITQAFARVAPNGVAAHFSIVTPREESGYHHDIKTDLRGLVTFKGAGTYWVADADLPQGLVRPADPDFYGNTSTAFMDVRRQVPDGAFVAWKGDQHKNPLIHSEPTSADGAQKRLRLLLNLR